MHIFLEILKMIAVLAHKFIWEDLNHRNKHAKSKIVKHVFKKTIVPNANQDIMSHQKIININVYNVLYKIVHNVKIPLDIVVPVFMDMLYISLKRHVKFLVYKIVKTLLMEGVSNVIMDIK
jgi:hypothetical protein